LRFSNLAQDVLLQAIAAQMTFDQLHRIVKDGDIVALRNALDGGLDPNLKNKFSWSLLMLTALEGNTALAELLIERGAELDLLNDFGESAVSLAAHQGHTSLLKILLSKGASLSCRPHGHSLEAWIRMSSGLPPHQIDMIALILAPHHENNRGGKFDGDRRRS
jgi:ankyrin repeat protein